MNLSSAHRSQIIVAHSAVVLWQAYSAFAAFRGGEILAGFAHGMNLQPGPGVQLFLLTFRWWLLVPLSFAALAVVSVRRLETAPTFSLGVLTSGVIVGLALNAWWREALFGPLLGLIGQIG